MDREDWREIKRQQQQRRLKRLPHRINLLKKICGTLNLMLEEKTGYQFRVTNPAKNKCIDIYPIHYRWHDLSNNTRGQVKGDAGLKSLIISKLISNGNGKEGKPKKKKPRRKKFKKYGKKPYAARTRLERPKDIPE